MRAYFYSNVHSGDFQKSQKGETAPVSINGWMDKQNVVYADSGILFSLKKKWSSETGIYDIDKTWRHFTKWNKSDTEEQTLYDPTYLRDLEESNAQWQEPEWQLPGCAEINRHRASAWGAGAVLEVDGGNDCARGSTLPDAAHPGQAP